jgi:hypothetical protein
LPKSKSVIVFDWSWIVFALFITALFITALFITAFFLDLMFETCARKTKNPPDNPTGCEKLVRVWMRYTRARRDT